MFRIEDVGGGVVGSTTYAEKIKAFKSLPGDYGHHFHFTEKGNFHWR